MEKTKQEREMYDGYCEDRKRIMAEMSGQGNPDVSIGMTFANNR